MTDTPNPKLVFLGKYLPAGSTRRRVIFRIAIVCLAFLLLLGIVDQIVMPIVTRQGSEFVLPDFTGKTVVDITSQLEDLSLSFEVASEEYAPGKEKGIILNQFPIAGTKVKPGRAIKFVMSLGQKIIEVPMVAGKSVRQAILDLESVGLTLGEIAWAFSDTIPEKVVVFSYPAAGTSVPMGSAVNLMVNRGRASDFTFMPKLVGMQLTDAKKLLEDKGLKVGLVKYRNDDHYLPDTILEQSELEGTELELGAEIDLVVSKT